AVFVQGNALHVPVENGLHLDELGIHVVGARFGHGRQSIGGNAGPGGDTNVDTLLGIGAQVLAPRVVADVDLGGRIEGIDARLAVAAEHNGPEVAGGDAIGFHQFDHGGDQVLGRVFDVDAVNLGRVQQPLGVLAGAEDACAGGQRVAADSFKYRGPV